MTERTGTLKERTLVLIVKKDWPSPTEYIYAEEGSVVFWDGERTNEGSEEPYGGFLYWCDVLHEGGIFPVGLSEDQVEWDE